MATRVVYVLWVGGVVHMMTCVVLYNTTAAVMYEYGAV